MRTSTVTLTSGEPVARAAHELLLDLQRRGLMVVALDDNVLEVEPTGELTGADIALLWRHCRDVLRLVAERTQ